MARISLFALTLLLIALALFVWRARPDSRINRTFATYTLLMSIWVLGIAGLHGGTYLDAWGRFTFASASLIPAAFFAFTSIYPNQSRWPSTALIGSVLLVGVIFSFLSVATRLLVFDVSMTPDGLSRKTGLLYPAFSAYFLTTWGAALFVFIAKWRKARGLARAQLQYLGAGILISGIGGIAGNLVLPILTGRSTYSTIGPFFSLILVALVGHAIIRHKLMDLRLVINRSLANLFVGGVISLPLVGICQIVVPDWNQQLIPLHPSAIIVVCVAALLVSSPAQGLISRLIDPYLYRGRIEHASALREATHRLSRLMQPVEVARELRDIINELFIPELLAIGARTSSNERLESLLPDVSPLERLFETAITLLAYRGPSVLVVTSDREQPFPPRAIEELKNGGVEVVVGLARRETLLGVILLGARRSGDPYYTRDLAFIESLAELGSIAFENARLYRQSLQMLEYSDRLVESLASAVVAIDVSGDITSFNPAARSLLGVRDHYRGKFVELLPSEISWALVFALTGSWRPREVEVTIDTEAGTPLPTILSTAQLNDDRGQVYGALIVVTDLSTVKALERNQRRAEHFATMARFYAGIAHEIRSPLAAISNFISMLPDRFDDREYRDTATRLLPLEVARIVRLADRLRLMAPSEGGKLTPVYLSTLLNDIVAIHAPAAEEQGMKICLESPEHLPPILGDQGQLVQLFVNLIKNGLEAMNPGGTLTIRGLEGPRRSTLTVEVIDEGLGIDPALASRIFQPFFTTKVMGTGLGLPICREIADFHRARLSLTSRTNRRGAVARVEFPVLLGDKEILEDATNPPDQPFNPFRR